MSRRHRSQDLYVAVTLECAAGHDTGSAFLLLPPHPRAGTFGLEAGVTFEDAAGPTGGRLRATCPTCGRVELVQWRRVHERLLELQAKGRHTGALRVHPA